MSTKTIAPNPPCQTFPFSATVKETIEVKLLDLKTEVNSSVKPSFSFAYENFLNKTTPPGSSQSGSDVTSPTTSEPAPLGARKRQRSGVTRGSWITHFMGFSIF